MASADFLSKEGVEELLIEALASRPQVDGANEFPAPVMEAIANSSEIEAVIAKALENFDGGEPDYYSAAFAQPSPGNIPVVTIAPYVLGSDEKLIREKRVNGSGTNADLLADPSFRYDGMLELPPDSANTAQYVTPQYLPGGSSQAARYQLRIETVATKTDTIKFRMRAKSTTIRLRIIVNGRWVNKEMMVFTGLTAGATYQILLTFPTDAQRTVTYEDAGSDTSFGGVAIKTAGALTRPTKEIKKRLIFIADSFGGGSSSPPNGATRMETWCAFVAKLMGADAWINMAIGGTGWLATANNFGTRIEAALAFQPTTIVFLGSRNDSAEPALIQAEVERVMGLLTGVPEVYVTGPSTSGFSSRNDAVKAGVIAAGRKFFDGIAEQWIMPGAPDIGTDNVHPTWLGHQKIARNYFENIDMYPEVPPVPPTPPGPPATLYFDDFNRADSTTSWGTPVTGNNYSASGTRTLIIESNAGGISTVTNNAYTYVMPFGPQLSVGSTSDGFYEAMIKYRTVGASKVPSCAFNYSGSGTTDMLLVQGNATSGFWEVRISNLLQTALVNIPVADGDTITFRRDLNNTVTIKINGVTLWTGVDTTLTGYGRIGWKHFAANADSRIEEAKVTALS